MAEICWWLECNLPHDILYDVPVVHACTRALPANNSTYEPTSETRATVKLIPRCLVNDLQTGWLVALTFPATFRTLEGLKRIEYFSRFIRTFPLQKS